MPQARVARRYAHLMALADPAGDGSPSAPSGLRESLGSPGAVAAARRRSMSERLELALSWNAVAAELRAGLARVTPAADQPPITDR